ncbi:hypothetical protein [Anaerorhabdus sp.]|uniref:hypothetical protein n=1 Tax=Anaerorhabdus sp. TaxID=1872524 RepID=UPI002FC66AA6
MEKLKQHCDKVLQVINNTYHSQLNYSGIIKTIYDSINNVVSSETDCDNLNYVDWESLIRAFADDTMDYSSPIILELEAIKKIAEKK